MCQVMVRREVENPMSGFLPYKGEKSVVNESRYKIRKKNECAKTFFRVDAL